MCDNPDKFAVLGTGTALYFYYVKYTCFALFLILGVSGIYN